SLVRCRRAAGSQPGPCAISRVRSCPYQPCLLLPRFPTRVRNGGTGGQVQFADQYLIDPAILRTIERGAKRVLAAPILFISPVTITARFLSSAASPASTTSAESIARRSNKPFPPKPATSPNSVCVGPGQRQVTRTPCGFNSS